MTGAGGCCWLGSQPPGSRAQGQPGRPLTSTCGPGLLIKEMQTGPRGKGRAKFDHYEGNPPLVAAVMLELEKILEGQ